MIEHHDADPSPDQDTVMDDMPGEPVPEIEAPDDDVPESPVRRVLETALTLGIALVLALSFRTFVVEPFVIPTGSMIPTIRENDHVLVNKFIYRFRAPKPGDIVVFDDPTGERPALLKRVIAVGGQTVEIDQGIVWVNGVPLSEPYTHGQTSEEGPYPTPATLPAGTVWLMGDNRQHSQDSRWMGPIPVSSLRGAAFAIYWPVGRIGPL